MLSKIVLMGGYGTGPAGFQGSVVCKLCYPWYTSYVCQIELPVTNSVFPFFLLCEQIVLGMLTVGLVYTR